MPERRVLVIDDNANIRAVLREALSDDGYEVREAGDGKAALAELEVWTPAVIILDAMMPVMDAWEFREQQRDLGRALEVPVIILSASRQVAELEAIGAAAIVAKPFDLIALLNVVAAVHGP